MSPQFFGGLFEQEFEEETAILSSFLNHKSKEIQYFCNRAEKNMTHSQFYKVTDSKLVITLPPEFKNKQVLVTVDDKVTTEKDKIALMKLAAKDPLFLSDHKEVNDDFEGIEHETN